MNLFYTTPLPRDPMLGGGTSAGVQFTMAFIDPDALTATATFWAIEDAGNPARPSLVIVVTGLTGADTLSGILTSFKAAIATKLGVTFQ